MEKGLLLCRTLARSVVFRDKGQRCQHSRSFPGRTLGLRSPLEGGTAQVSEARRERSCWLTSGRQALGSTPVATHPLRSNSGSRKHVWFYKAYQELKGEWSVDEAFLAVTV